MVKEKKKFIFIFKKKFVVVFFFGCGENVWYNFYIYLLGMV